MGNKNSNNKNNNNNENNNNNNSSNNNNNNNKNGSTRGFATTFNDLLQRVVEANAMASPYSDSSGRKLKFELFPRKQSDVIIPILWKLLVHVRVSKEPADRHTPKLLSFEQFSFVYKKLKEFEGFSTPGGPGDEHEGESEKECTICMERDATLVLPCFHSFCEECIQLWRSKSETCPVCRVTMEGQTDDCFVLASPPTNNEVQSFFSEFFDNIQGMDFGD